MNSISLFILVVCIIAILFLALNLILAPHNPYVEKFSAFECGFHSFLQTRSQFNVSFYIYGILFLILDLEIFLVFPYAISSFNNGVYGLVIMLIFTFIITLGFVFELGKGVLNIYNTKNFNISKSLTIGYKL